MDSPNVDGRDAPQAGSSALHDMVMHPGARLRERREMQKLSLESVAMQLRTSVKTIRALEENDLAKLPPPVYVRGFLRGYARLVSLPESEVIDVGPPLPSMPRPMAASAAPAAEMPLDLESRRWPAWALTGILAFGAVAATAFIAWQLWSSRPAADPIATAGSPVPVQPEVTAALPLPPEAAASPTPVAAASGEAAPPTAPAAPPTPTPAPVPEPAQPPAATPPQAAPAEAAPLPANALVLRFAGESWVTVVDAAGKRLLYEAGLPGTTKTVSGQPPLKVTLGRPGNVSLEFNGQPFAHSYTEKSGPARLKIGG